MRRQPRRGAVAALSAEKGTVYGGTKERRRPFLAANRSYRPEGPGNPYRPLRPVRRRLPLTGLNPRRSSFPCPAKTTGKMPVELMGKIGKRQELSRPGGAILSGAGVFAAPSDRLGWAFPGGNGTAGAAIRLRLRLRRDKPTIPMYIGTTGYPASPRAMQGCAGYWLPATGYGLPATKTRISAMTMKLTRRGMIKVSAAAAAGAKVRSAGREG